MTLRQYISVFILIDINCTIENTNILKKPQNCYSVLILKKKKSEPFILFIKTICNLTLILFIL